MGKTEGTTNFTRDLRVGDIIYCQGMRDTISEILSQHTDSKYCDIEYKDKYGRYRHWQSWEDGGSVKYRNKVERWYSEKFGMYLVPIDEVESDEELLNDVLRLMSTGWVAEKASKSELEGFEKDSYHLINIEKSTNGIILASKVPDAMKKLSELMADYGKKACDRIPYDVYLGSDLYQSMIDYCISIPRNYVHADYEQSDWIGLIYNRADNCLELVAVEQ